MNKRIYETAVQTIKLEAESIARLADYINDNFENAVHLIHNSGGRVVVSGIGKSAIVGQKITATLNSTGTPALFMHAADAIHGDLGMVQQNDVVLIISKSGESPEVRVLVPLIKSFQNKLIGLVGNPDSFLAQQSDVYLNSSVEQEACPNNLAPTTSTTAQMVIGDALAICLMELNEFSFTDFAKYHPGGNLGKRMYLRVSDLYTQNATPKVYLQTPLKEVIMQITKGRVGAAVIVNHDNTIVGIITDGDIRRLLEKTDELKYLQAKDIFINDPKTIEPDVLAVNALEVLKKFDINQLVVRDAENKYLGIIHLHDLIREGII